MIFVKNATLQNEVTVMSKGSYKSSPSFRRFCESSINPGKKYQKMYYGKYDAERDKSIYDTSEVRTFVNYGVISKYCDNHKVLHHNPLETPAKCFKGALCYIGNMQTDCDLIKVRLTTAELKIIKNLHRFVPLYLRQKIKSRELN